MAYATREDAGSGGTSSGPAARALDTDTRGTMPSANDPEESSEGASGRPELSEPSAVSTKAGAQSATIVANRASGSVTANGTKMAPIHNAASAATTKSTELGRRRATR